LLPDGRGCIAHGRVTSSANFKSLPAARLAQRNVAFKQEEDSVAHFLDFARWAA
jgi:hypothetical protein